MKKTTKTFYIGGMTCVNCQNRIERALSKEPGVFSSQVDYRSGKAEVSFDTERTDWDRIEAVIEALDYTVSESRDMQKPDYISVIGQIVIILSLFYILDQFGILTLLVPDKLADSGMGFGMLFIIGLITSVHCIAMCGGINLSQSLPKDDDSERKGGGLIYPTVLYNAGRVVSYTVTGLLLGGIGFLIGGGSGIGLPVLLQGILKIVAGIFMVIMGVNMLGLFPALKKLTLPGAGKFGGRLYRFIRGKNSSFAVGVLNGLMPCGPLQSMWIVALASGSPAVGALSMLMFSLGTVPLMLGLGSIISVLGKRFVSVVTKAGAVLVATLGLAMLSQGGALAGMSFSSFHPSVSQTVSEGTAINRDGIQYVNSTLSAGKYPTITVEQGIPVRWTIDAPEGSINGCNYRVIFSELGMEHSFEEGENIIEFLPEKVGTIPYTCWMGMIRGNINVVSRSEDASGDANGVVLAQTSVTLKKEGVLKHEKPGKYRKQKEPVVNRLSCSNLSGRRDADSCI